MPDAAVSGRATIGVASKRGALNCAGDKRSPWRAGACGNKSEPFWRRWALRIMVPWPGAA